MSSHDDEILRLVNCSLDEVIEALITTTPIARGAGSGSFRLPGPDSVGAFEFYARRRDLWPRKHAVQAREIDELLESLDAAPAPRRRHARDRRHARTIWTLTRLEAHRFGGLHRHCGPKGEDPQLFILEFDKDVTLIAGFNGAGKTALLSAIIWCITGKALRSQHMPDEVHEPMPVEWAEQGRGEEDGVERRHPFAIPPIVPIPGSEELESLSEQPRLDTWVRLTLMNSETGEVRNVTRKLVTRPGRRTIVHIEGLDELGLTRTALEVGTLMPGVAASMRFDEKTDFAQTIAQLTGLKPLEDLGRRMQRVVRRLEGDETKTTERARAEKLQLFIERAKRFVESWEVQSDLGKMPDILLPDQKAQNRDCASSVNAIRDNLRQKQTALTTALETILGRRLEFGTKADVDQMVRTIDQATDLLRGAALATMRSIATISRLAKISEDDIVASDAVLSDLLRRAAEMAARQANERGAARWQLYARVAMWHREHHANTDMASCPVCSSDLDAAPADALVDVSVKEALARCRNVDADMAKTVAQWEQDEAVALADSLPKSVGVFIDEQVPGDLEDLFRLGYVDELLSQDAFGGRLEALRRNGKALWAKVCLETPLPTRPQDEDERLPVIFQRGKVATRVANVSRALKLAKHRNISKGALGSRVRKYIGSATEVQRDVQTHEQETVADQTPLRNQLETIRRAVRNASPIVLLMRQLDEIDAARREWELKDKRLQVIARAIPAITPFLEFPALVHEQVTGLIETLDQGTRAWLAKLYRPHYLGGPGYSGFDAMQETGVGLRAGMGEMRVPAHHVMNASLLRACVWAFLFSLWEHVHRHTGGLDCLLLDDPQTHFDPINSENLAAAIPVMPEHGIRPVVATNDARFMAAIQSALPRKSAEIPTWTALQLNPISSSRLTASASPAIDEIRDRRDRWREDENDRQKAQEFVGQVRLDVENRLWNLLARDPIVLHNPTLGHLLNELRGARSRGERPFDEKPFELLLTNQNLRDNARFYQVINKAHHRKADIVPADAADVDRVFEGIDNLLRSCTASYARFMGRLTREDEQLFLLERPSTPTAVTLEAQEIAVLGQLAARSTSDMLAETEQIERFDLAELGPVAFFAIRGSTLGWLALSGQTVIVAVDREARDGDPVIALSDGRVYARRLGRDERDPSRITLLADRSGTENVPPTLLLPRARTLVMPIVAVLFDSRRMEGSDEAVQVDGSPLLLEDLHGARVVEESAHPTIRDGDIVLMKPLSVLDRDSIAALEGAIVAAIASRNGEAFGFLKRVGEEMSAQMRIFENIGLNGASVAMTVGAEPDSDDRDTFVLQRLWLVHGVVRLSGR